MKKIPLEAFADAVADVIGKVIAGPRVAGRLDALERRLQALEGKPHVKFLNKWEAGRTYTPLDAVTHHGGLWICKARVETEPGVDLVCWQRVAR